jgi:two-component system response regulator NreC
MTDTDGNGASRSSSSSREVSPVARIVLADDHPVVRRGLRILLDEAEGLEVVAEAGDVDTAVRKVRGHKPEVLVLDLSMPGGSGLEAIPRVLEASPRTAIVVLTMQDEPEVARAALRAGALGFVLKEAADSELQDALHAALGGRPYLNPQLGARIASEPEATPNELSDREVEVLRLLALGYTNSEIADRLFLSVRTVESHRSNLAHKIGVASRFELVGYAREHGLFG